MKETDFENTDIGKIPRDWEVKSIAEVSEIIIGGTPKTSVGEYWNGKIPWIAIEDINNGDRFISKTNKKITKKGLTESSTKILKKNSIIISARGTVGMVAQLEKDMAFNQSCYGLIGIKDNITNDFLYYSLKDKIELLKRRTHGSVFDTIIKDTFKNIYIFVPKKNEQEKITKILSSLDYKIELNNKINRTLEKIGETIFKHWFIDFEFPDKNGNPYKSSGREMIESELGMIPKGWKVGVIKDVANLTMGLSPKSSSYNTNYRGLPLLNGAVRF